MRPRASLKEVRHLEEKSSRGFRFLRHRHKQRMLLQNKKLKHPPKTEPCAISEPRNRTIVTNKLWYQCQWRNARNRTLLSEEIHLRNKVWWISTATKGWQQSNNNLAPPTIDPRQMVRATASSPSDKSYLRTLSIEERSTPETKSDGSQQRAFTPENSDGTQQSMSLMKTPGRWFNNKRLTVSNTLLQEQDPPQKQSLMDLNHWTDQSKYDSSIITDRSGVPPYKQDVAQAPRSTSKTKFDGSPQKQLTAPINHLKEEPSAPQSLSIFDST